MLETSPVENTPTVSFQFHFFFVLFLVFLFMFFSLVLLFPRLFLSALKREMGGGGGYTISMIDENSNSDH